MMDNFDSNMIRPVEGLQNITGLAPTRRREQRKKREHFNSEHNEQQNQNKEENMTKQFDEPVNIKGDDENKIDFCA